MDKLQKPNQKTRKRIGRGGKRGTYSGRGMKGQKSRAGAGIRPEFRMFLQKIPKLRGADTQTKDTKSVVLVQLRALEKSFASGDTVSSKTLCDKQIISRFKGRLPGIKIIGNNPVTKKLVIVDCALSSNARAQIEKAGGTIR